MAYMPPLKGKPLIIPFPVTLAYAVMLPVIFREVRLPAPSCENVDSSQFNGDFLEFLAGWAGGWLRCK